MKMTVSTIKAMATAPHLISLAETVFKAMAYEQCIADVVKPKQQEVIDFFKFPIADKWLREGEPKQITSEKDMFLAAEEDFQIYLKEMNAFFTTTPGLSVPAFGYCPLLMAESMTREAKRLLVDALEPFTGLSFDQLICSGLKNYHEYIELNLKIFAPRVKVAA